MNKNTLGKLLSADEESAWEVFHEASKTSPYDAPPSNEAVRLRMTQMYSSFPYADYPETALPLPLRPERSLGDLIHDRATSRDICAAELPLVEVSTLLFSAYGESRDETAKGYPRPFRVIPSGGAMYPLELYVHVARVEGLSAGLYHYNVASHALTLLSEGDKTRPLSAALIQNELALEASLFVFIVAVADRSTFKYGERGYRFVLLEAGHLAQNFVLTAQALGRGAVTVGGYLDRSVDALIGLDGLQQSVVYILAAGGRSGQDWLGL